MTGPTQTRTRTIAIRLLVSLFVLAPYGAQAEGTSGRFDDSIGLPIGTIDDDELGREVGLGLSAIGGDAGGWAGERIAVILWDEAKPHRPQPQFDLAGGQSAAGASISVNVGGLAGR